MGVYDAMPLLNASLYFWMYAERTKLLLFPGFSLANPLPSLDKRVKLIPRSSRPISTAISSPPNGLALHTPHILTEALSWHQRFLDAGDMRV